MSHPLKGVSSEIRTPRRRRKKKKQRHRDIMSVEGVRKIILSELAQKIIGCVAGENVTSENPWMMVRKELIQDNIELHEESSEFLPIRNEILAYPRPELLIGYIPDDRYDYDEFYICVTEQALATVNDIISKIKAEQEGRLYNAINKKIKMWVSQGSEVEVDEEIVKNSRALIEVEVESEYPIFSAFKPQFQITKAEQMRDGYMELRCYDTTINNVFKKRIDAKVQVAPQFITAEAQTTCTYPSNSTTQYQYEIENTEELFKKCEKNIQVFTEEHYEDLSDVLTVNGALNLYSDDFANLVNNPKFAKAVAKEEVKEYMSFMDVHMCKGKMIADAVWHPMWTGIVAVAYADAAPSIFYSGHNQDDVVMKAVHGVNPVLMWSCLDALKPRLILETPREVHKLSFCNFDPNILVGGCSNGQVILWDIRNKLEKVEELEVLTNAQQRYRAQMHSLMGWMKNIHNISIVRPTVVSDLRNSHKGPVTGITWISPHHEFSKLGNLSALEDDEISMQFLTSSEDGTVCIWDLLKKPTIQPGGFKPRKLKRLKRKPSALIAEVSPYAPLHLNLKPIYRVNLIKGDKQNRNVGIASSSGKLNIVKYAEVRPEKNKKRSLHERVIYRPVLDPRRDSEWKPETKLHCGTMEGDYIYMRWEGKDYESGEVVNSELSKIESYSKCHDGPVNTCKICEKSPVTLTVGGKVIALWREDFPNRPVLWRRYRHNMFTTGEWDIFQPSRFMVEIMNGDVESWSLHNNSKYPTFHLIFSSGYLTTTAIHPRPLKKLICGAGDKQGVFRLFFLPQDTSESEGDKVKDFENFINREVNRKKKFLAWQEEWNKKNESFLKLRQEQERELMELDEQAKKAKEAELMEEKAVEVVVRKGPAPGKYIEWVIEQRQLEEEARIKSTIISKKQLDTKELEKRRKPLQKLDEENERKKRKQRMRLREGENIFKETVATLFPDAIKEKPAPPPDPYIIEDEGLTQAKSHFNKYLDIDRDANAFVAANPYKYEFSWRSVLDGCRQRRKQLFLDSLCGGERRKTKKSLESEVIASIAEAAIESGQNEGGGQTEGEVCEAAKGS
ncbi:unnamed protein product [Callosobruchus maculatus]|uniref:WD repeat-containing protein 63 n=1 Tax=Callosobruchus maculatus TaxID=64391 RepID=A0A653C936_CALMS|nr:unnamed protein product [Callosobruchus maculatus]